MQVKRLTAHTRPGAVSRRLPGSSTRSRLSRGVTASHKLCQTRDLGPSRRLESAPICEDRRVNRQTALGTEPVSRLWLTNPVRHQAATLERLRVDRQLEEALTHGPDPLHLAEVFGIAEMTAIRYATAARQILESSAEAEPMSSSSTHGLTTDQHTDGPTGSR